MSYTKNTWKSGDIVTSAKLNKMEQGIASSGGVLMVHFNKGILDKTWKEIQEAMQEKIVCIYVPDPQSTAHLFVAGTFFDGSNYGVIVFTVMPDGSVDNPLFFTDSENGYPVMMSGGNDVPEQ